MVYECFKGQTQIISVVLIMGLAVGVMGASYMWGKPLIEKSQAGSAIAQAEKTMEIIKDTIDDVAQSGGQKTKEIQFEGTLEVSGSENELIYRITSPKAAIASSQWVVLNDDVPPNSEETFAVTATDPTDSTNITSCNPACVMKATCGPDSVVMSGAGCPVSGNTYNVGDSFVCGSNTYTVDHIDCTPGGDIDGFAVLLGPTSDVAGVAGVNNAGVIVAKSIPIGGEYNTVYKLIYRELVDPSSKEGTKIIIKNTGNSRISDGRHTIIVKRGDIKVNLDASDLGGDLTETTVFVTLE